MCSCKNGSTNKQVTTVKQVVKPQVVANSPKPAQTPVKKTTTRRIIFKRHM